MSTTNTMEAPAIVTNKPEVAPHAIPHGVLEHDVKSSSVLAPSATMLAQSGVEYDIPAAVKRIANIKLKLAASLTRERCNLNAGKLVSSVLADYRHHHAGVYGKGQRIPSDVYEKIQDAVGEFITGTLATALTAANTVSIRKQFVFRKPRLVEGKPDTNGLDNDTERWMLKTVAEGEDELPFREMALACSIEIGRIEKRLKDLLAKPNPDLELEGKYKAKLLRQQSERTYIVAEAAKAGIVIS